MTPTLKRLAWRYGCAKAGSTEEALALAALLERVAELQRRPEHISSPMARVMAELASKVEG